MSIINFYQVCTEKTLLQWSRKNLAEKSGASLFSIARVESVEGIPEGQNIKTLLVFKSAFEVWSIKFISALDRLWGRSSNRINFLLQNKK